MNRLTCRNTNSYGLLQLSSAKMGQAGRLREEGSDELKAGALQKEIPLGAKPLNRLLHAGPKVSVGFIAYEFVCLIG